jgi:hypothetical protein
MDVSDVIRDNDTSCRKVRTCVSGGSILNIELARAVGKTNALIRDHGPKTPGDPTADTPALPSCKYV